MSLPTEPLKISLDDLAKFSTALFEMSTKFSLMLQRAERHNNLMRELKSFYPRQRLESHYDFRRGFGVLVEIKYSNEFRS